MNRYVSILRGINVGGQRKILMNDLKRLFERLGFLNVITYIQSGNVIFDSVKTLDSPNLEEFIEQAVLKSYKFEVPVIIRKDEELNNLITKNPFLNEKPTNIDRLHLTLLKKEPFIENQEKLKNFDFSPDKFYLDGKNIFVYCSGRYSDSKLTNTFFERKLKATATTRNWKTMLKLAEMITTGNP